MELKISIDDVNLEVSISDETFKQFAAKLAINGESMGTVLERMMREYVGKNSTKVDFNALTEKLLKKFSQKNVGQLANKVLRKLLEKGVANKTSEIELLQMASGARTAKNLQIQRGFYVSENFGLSFPLLITEDHKQYDTGNNFFVAPLKINGNEYYLCSQWVQNNHREKLEAWIRKRLPPWLASTDDQKRNEIINWINNEV
ncbi:MAG: hypothetical protein IJ685_03415 [Selenomonadaceae bacterium]|nr:hypothetical protein [Selenomonadaceae bacterium]